MLGLIVFASSVAEVVTSVSAAAASIATGFLNTAGNVLTVVTTTFVH